MRIRVTIVAVVALAVCAALLAAAPPTLRALHLHWPAWTLALAGAVITAVVALARPLTAVVTRSWADRVQEQFLRRDRARHIEHNLTGQGKGLPLARQMTDRAVLGIHPAIPLPPGADHELSPDLPLYVARDIDDDLRAWVGARQQRGGFLLIAGPAAAGKTRTAYQLICDSLADWPVLMPATASQLTTYAEAGRMPAKLVVWLNEIQNYLGPDGLTAATIRRLLSAPQRVIIIATIWPDRYDLLAAAPAGADSAATHDPGREAREILTILASRVDLPAGFTLAEQQRAASLAARDPRLAQALAHQGNENVPETLAAAPQLTSRWLNAANPYGAAVITAAVTARRCGHAEPIPADVLESLAERCLTSTRLAAASPAWFAAALQWAREPVCGQAAPLTPQANAPGIITGDNVSDILVHRAGRDPAVPWRQIPGQAWLLLIEHATPSACQDIAATAFPYRAAQQVPAAERAARKAADAGLPGAMTTLAVLLQHQGHTADAASWYRKAANAGHADAMYNLGFLLSEQQQAAHAVRWYRKAAAVGHMGAMSSLAALLREQGHASEADHWDNRAAEAGQIVRVFKRLSDDPARVAMLRQNAADGDPDAMRSLGFVHAEQGQLKQARQWYTRAAEAGDAGAMNNLAMMLAQEGHPDQAENWYLKAIAAGGAVAPGAMYNLGRLLVTQARADEAEQWYRKSAAIGHTGAMTSLADLLAQQEHADQAEQWYHKAATAGDWTAPAFLEAVTSGKVGAHGIEEGISR